MRASASSVHLAHHVGRARTWSGRRPGPARTVPAGSPQRGGRRPAPRQGVNPKGGRWPPGQFYRTRRRSFDRHGRSAIRHRDPTDAGDATGHGRRSRSATTSTARTRRSTPWRRRSRLGWARTRRSSFLRGRWPTSSPSACSPDPATWSWPVARQHIVAYEGGAAGRNAGVQFHLAPDDDGTVHAADLRWALDAVAPPPPPRHPALCREHPHARQRGPLAPRRAASGRGLGVGRRRGRAHGRRPPLACRGGHRHHRGPVCRHRHHGHVLPLQGAVRARRFAARRPGRRHGAARDGAGPPRRRDASSRESSRRPAWSRSTPWSTGWPTITAGPSAWPRWWPNGGRRAGCQPDAGPDQHRDLPTLQTPTPCSPISAPRESGPGPSPRDRAPGDPPRRRRRGHRTGLPRFWQRRRSRLDQEGVEGKSRIRSWPSSWTRRPPRPWPSTPIPTTPRCQAAGPLPVGRRPASDIWVCICAEGDKGSLDPSIDPVALAAQRRDGGGRRRARPRRGRPPFSRLSRRRAAR